MASMVQSVDASMAESCSSVRSDRVSQKPGPSPVCWAMLLIHTSQGTVKPSGIAGSGPDGSDPAGSGSGAWRIFMMEWRYLSARFINAVTSAAVFKCE
jgi:hypothetical protein